MIAGPAADLEKLGCEDLVGVLAQVQVLLELVFICLAELVEARVELLRLLAQVAEALLVRLRELLIQALELTLRQRGVEGFG